MNKAVDGNSVDVPDFDTAIHDALSKTEQALLDWFAPLAGVVVAYSGGVDSAVVTYAAYRALGARSLAAIADSPSLARSELQAARQLAVQIGIQLQIIQTQEVSDPSYQVNDAQRCFHCKNHLYLALQELPQVRVDHWVILSGTNADDLGDWRPGLRAAEKHAVRSPLAELQIDKPMVRRLAQHWGLPVADKPASPCLSSRLAYGLTVTPERLAMVERAEAELRRLGFSQFRVRLHADNLARIEVPLGELPRLIAPEVRQPLVTSLAAIGFRYVSLDLEGFASGSLNKLIPLADRTGTV